jgi:methylisocitrate lyase
MVVAPSCFDPLSARLAELAGFEAIHLTGLGIEATQLAAPDLGLLTLTEIASHAARIAAAIGIPILADIDTGFGGVLNVRRTIREMERAGVAGVHIEDQAMPKHCPLLAGRKVVSRSEGIDRIKAACDARTDADFVIVARSDADVVSFDEVVERCNLYLEAGADMAMPMIMNVQGKSYFSLPPDEQMDWARRLTQAIEGPVMGMGNSPPAGYSAKDMAEAGYSFIMFAGTALGAAANAMAEVFREIRKNGSDAAYFATHPGTYQDPLALMRAVHLDAYADFERKYTGAL